MATDVLVPPLGQTVDTVMFVTWYKQEGEAVQEGEMLFAIETDKATMDVEAPASGVLRRISAQPGDEVRALSPVGLIAAPDEVVEEDQPASVTEPTAQTPAAPASSGNEPQKQLRGDRIFISPRARRLAEARQVPITELEATGPEGAIVERDVRAYLEAESTPAITPTARRMAEEAGLDWHELPGSGPSGRITRDDVAQVVDEKPILPETAATDREGEREVLETIPVRSVRAIIAERMAESAATTAAVTLTTEADATALVELRRELSQDGIEVAYNDLFLAILARSLRDHPRLNASFEEDVIKVWQQIDIGLAVDTDRGLVVPVVRDVASKGLQALAEETKSLIQRTQAGQVTPEELRGATFTLTNLGMYGIDAFTPLINLPEGGILGVGRIKLQPVVVGDEVVGRQMVWLSLTFDHRLVDGAPAARFLQRIGQLVERPHLLMS